MFDRFLDKSLYIIGLVYIIYLIYLLIGFEDTVLIFLTCLLPHQCTPISNLPVLIINH